LKNGGRAAYGTFSHKGRREVKMSSPAHETLRKHDSAARN
jgi:hypothetical protein